MISRMIVRFENHWSSDQNRCTALDGIMDHTWKAESGRPTYGGWWDEVASRIDKSATASMNGGIWFLTAVVSVCLSALTFGQGMPEQYEALRVKLLRDGWTPTPSAEQLNCEAFETWCDSRKELDYCQIVGPIPRCGWNWSKGQNRLYVTTLMDGDIVEKISIDEYPASGGE